MALFFVPFAASADVAGRMEYSDDPPLPDGFGATSGGSPYAGFQFGIAAPIAPVPLSSANFFIGYANKEADGWWARRFGFRADVALPVNQSSTAVVRDETDVHLNFNLAGSRHPYALNNLFDPLSINGTKIDLTGVNGRVIVNDARFGGLVDFYPFGNTTFIGGFRVSGGFYTGQMNIDVHAVNPDNLPPDGFRIVDIGTTGAIRARLQSGARATGRLTWNYTGPYGGVGWDIGVWRGFKIFIDAGVIFTNAPKLHDRDVMIPEDKIQLCYAIGNGAFCGWTNIDINDITGTTAGMLSGLMDGILAAPGGNFNGINVALLQTAMAGLDTQTIAAGLAAWVVGGTPPSWYQNVPPQIDAIVRNAIAHVNDVYLSDVQNVINEYHRGRAGTIQDINKTLADFPFYPIVRIGVMYRF